MPVLSPHICSQRMGARVLISVLRFVSVAIIDVASLRKLTVQDQLWAIILRHSGANSKAKVPEGFQLQALR